MMKKLILDDNAVLNMFKNLDVSIAVLDEEMNILYMNDKARWFYKTVFSANDILGKNVHQPVNIKNIHALFDQFREGKPFSYFHADPPMIEGGQITVLHFPYKVDGEVKGVMEINVLSSLMDDGLYQYERKFEE